MLKYENLKQKPREFLAATGVTDEEFQILLPNFARGYEILGSGLSGGGVVLSPNGYKTTSLSALR